MNIRQENLQKTGENLMTCLNDANAFGSIFVFFANAQSQKKRKRVTKPTHKDTANNVQ